MPGGTSWMTEFAGKQVLDVGVNIGLKLIRDLTEKTDVEYFI
jgi:hypothetical protein